MDAFFASAAEYFQGSGSGFVSVFCTVWRYLAPVLAVLLLWRCARPLLKFRREPETWAWLVMPDGNQLPLTHWENILGRAKGCDIVVDFPTPSGRRPNMSAKSFGQIRPSQRSSSQATNCSTANYEGNWPYSAGNSTFQPRRVQKLGKRRRNRT